MNQRSRPAGIVHLETSAARTNRQSSEHPSPVAFPGQGRGSRSLSTSGCARIRRQTPAIFHPETRWDRVPPDCPQTLVRDLRPLAALHKFPRACRARYRQKRSARRPATTAEDWPAEAGKSAHGYGCRRCFSPKGPHPGDIRDSLPISRKIQTFGGESFQIRCESVGLLLVADKLGPLTTPMKNTRFPSVLGSGL